MHESGETGLTHVLAVDDDPSVRDLITTYLGDYDMRVTAVPDAQEMSKVLAREAVDLVLLDLRLKGEDGMDIARKLRATSKLPIIILTGRQDDADRVMGLELGADDYLTKPFSPRELVARIRGILRRHDGVTEAPLAVGAIVLDRARRTVIADGADVALTATEFDLLAKLMSSPGQVFSREQLLSSVWGHADYGAGRTVDVHVAQVRAKLGEANPIRTVRGVGYSAS